MADPTSVSRALTVMGIPHRVFVHPEPPRTLEQAAEERGQRPEQIVRSILFRISQSEYLMVLMAGPTQIDWKALRKYLGKSRITTASKDEVLSMTGYELGAVAPFGLPAPMRVLVYESVLKQTEISLGSGVRGTAILVTTKDLMTALGEADVVRLGN